MKTSTILVTLGAIVMSAALVWGFASGGGWEAVRVLLSAPWFVVSLVDVYIGFALFAGWVVYREKPAIALPVVVSLFLLGNVVACLYVLVALQRCGSDWERFWLGRRVPQAVCA